MAVLTGYYDETGDTRDPSQKFVGMAGFVAPADSWRLFERKWKFILNEFKIPYFHMREFAPSVGVFNGWKGKEDKRQSLFHSLIETIREIKPLPVGCIFSSDDFRALSEQDKKLIGDPYYLSFLTCLGVPCFFVQNAPPEIRLATVFGEHSLFESKAREFHKYIKAAYAVGDRLYPPDFRDMRQFVPLQAADIMAYELYKEADRQRYRPDDNSRFGIIEFMDMKPAATNANTLIIATKEHLESMVAETKRIRAARLTGSSIPVSPLRLR